MGVVGARGGSSSTWGKLDNPTNCGEAIAAFEQATGRSRPLPVPPRRDPLASASHRPPRQPAGAGRSGRASAPGTGGEGRDRSRRLFPHLQLC